MKAKIAIVRGKFLNKYEMQFFEPLVDRFDITAFGSLTPFHDSFAFPVNKLASPMDVPEFPFKMSILNRIFIDAQYLLGLEKKLEGFDLAHTAETYYHYTHQALNAKKAGKVKKVIATVLENIPFNNEGILGRVAFKKQAREELDHIIALTQRTKATLLLEGANEKKITVIPHHVDTKRFFPRMKTTSVNPKKIGLLFCGRLEVYKGVYEIVEAVKLLTLNPELSDYEIECKFIGEGTEKNALIQLINRLNIKKHIAFTSVSYTDMPRIYQEADIYVAPSKASPTWIEQYNTTLLEAQASGLPIVTSYSGGIPENVADAAIMVPPNDSYALSEAIKQFILYPQKRLEYAVKARSRAETVHDAQIGAEKLAALYQRVLHETE